jgi:pseudouridine kinase
MKDYIIVIGAVNIDIIAQSLVPLVNHDSNPGTVSVNLGGVGRNIAENLARLEIPIKLISVMGDDIYQQLIIDHHQQLKIDMSLCLHLTNAKSSTYLAITDQAGEMKLAINDMAIIEQLTPSYLSQYLTVINQSKAVVMDTNLSQATIDWLMQEVKRPIFVDPVSTYKAQKLTKHLSKIYGLKPNSLEAEILTSSQYPYSILLDQLLQQGISQVYLSLGSEGICLADNDHKVKLTVSFGPIVNTTGCGDALMAGIIYGWYHDETLVDCGLWGLAMALLTAGVPGATNHNINQQLLMTVKEQIQCTITLM